MDSRSKAIENIQKARLEQFNRLNKNVADSKGDRLEQLSNHTTDDIQHSTLSFLCPIQQFRSRRLTALYPIQRRYKAMLYQTSADVFHRLGPTVEAAAIDWSVQFGPSASAFSKICARRTFWLLPFNHLMTSCSSLFSDSLNRTMYRFCIKPSVVLSNLAHYNTLDNPHS